MAQARNASITFTTDTAHWAAMGRAISADLDKVAARALRNRANELNRQADELDPPSAGTAETREA